MTITALVLSLASPLAALGDGFDSFLDGGAGVPTESSVLVPGVDPGALAFGDGAAVVGDDGGESSAFVDGTTDGRVVYPGSEPGVIPYGGGDDGGFGSWSDPVDIGSAIFRPVSPRWVVQTDALFLWQGNIGSRPLFVDNASTIANPSDPLAPIPSTVLDANQGRTQAGAGPRVGVILNLDNIYSVEGNYFYASPFNSAQSTPVSADTYQMVNLAGFPPFSDIGYAQFTTNAVIQSAELNWRRRTCGPVTWLSGFRWVEWRQGMNIVDQYQGGTSVESISTSTLNDLYGGQAGADVMLWNNGGPIRFNAVGKAGVFLNNAVQHTSGFSERIVPNSLGPVAAAAQQTAFFGELGIFGTWQMTDWLAWRTGYNFFWLSGVAVPVDQLATTKLDPVNPTATINTNGSVFLNGVQFGLESRW